MREGAPCIVWGSEEIPCVRLLDDAPAQLRGRSRLREVAMATLDGLKAKRHLTVLGTRSQLCAYGAVYV
jgi:hypothetical protein